MFGFVTLLNAEAADLAYVRSASSQDQEARGDQGSAWLFHRGGVCYAATPRHVLIGAEGSRRDDRYARIAVVRPGRQPIEAQADRCAVFKDYDLALMRVTGIADLAECGNVLIGQASIDPLLAAETQASLLTATESGSFVRRPLIMRSARVNDSDHFWVTPAAAGRDVLTKSMSGGHVTIQNRLAGFLVTIGTQPPIEGLARALRSDRVSVLITRLFADPSLAHVDSPACLQAVAEGPTPALATRLMAPSLAATNRADQGCGASVSAWSSPPMSPAFRPDNLVGAGGADGRWRAWATEEVTVDVRLCGTGRSAISRLRFETSGCEPGDNVGSNVEVIVLGPSRAPVTSLGYAPMPTSGVVEVGEGGPVRGAEIKLRFTTRGQGRDPVCAGPLLVD